MRIDAEVRFWRRSNTPTRFQNAPLLTQDYLPQHLEPHLMEHGFTGCVVFFPAYRLRCSLFACVHEYSVREWTAL